MVELHGQVEGLEVESGIAAQRPALLARWCRRLRRWDLANNFEIREPCLVGRGHERSDRRAVVVAGRRRDASDPSIR